MENNKIILDVEIPVNTTATVYVPAASADAVLENGNVLSSLKEIDVPTVNGPVDVVPFASACWRIFRFAAGAAEPRPGG